MPVPSAGGTRRLGETVNAGRVSTRRPRSQAEPSSGDHAQLGPAWPGLLARPESARPSAYGRPAEVVVHRNRLMLKPITLSPAMHKGMRLYPDHLDNPYA